jgi:PAS domain S-box-containing protein
LIVLEEEIGFGQLRTVTQYQIRASYNITPQALPAFEPLLDVAPLIRNDFDESGAPYDTNIVDLQARVRQVESKLGYTLGQVVGLPLLFEDELLGMIYLFRTEYAFTQLDWQFLQGFADQAAVAVRNSRLYHQLETERSRLATIVENSAHGILILDAERRVLVINQAMAAMLGVTPQSCVGKGCQEVLNLQDVQGDDICQMDNFTGFPNRESLHCEGDLQRPGGSRLTVSVTYTPLYDEEERLVNIIVNVIVNIDLNIIARKTQLAQTVGDGGIYAFGGILVARPTHTLSLLSLAARRFAYAFTGSSAGRSVGAGRSFFGAVGGRSGSCRA